jgi:hypothetical protein
VLSTVPGVPQERARILVAAESHRSSQRSISALVVSNVA